MLNKQRAKQVPTLKLIGQDPNARQAMVNLLGIKVQKLTDVRFVKTRSTYLVSGCKLSTKKYFFGPQNVTAYCEKQSEGVSLAAKSKILPNSRHIKNFI